MPARLPTLLLLALLVCSTTTDAAPEELFSGFAARRAAAGGKSLFQVLRREGIKLGRARIATGQTLTLKERGSKQDVRKWCAWAY